MGRVLFWVLSSCLLACSTGSAPSLSERPEGRFDGEYRPDVVRLHLTPEGVQALNTQWRSWFDGLAPGATFELEFPCQVRSLGALGEMAIADEGAEGCTEERCGRLDGVCDARDVPATVRAIFEEVTLSPQGPDLLVGTARVRVTTGRLMVSSTNRNHGLCLFTSPLKCGLDFDSARTAPVENDLALRLRFQANPRWKSLLSVEVEALTGANRCGAAGAQPPPACLDAADLNVSREGGCVACSLAQLGLVRDAILDDVAGAVRRALQAAVTQATCEPCDDQGGCPSGARCEQRGGQAVCVDAQDGRCAPRVLGLDGLMQLAELVPGGSQAQPADVSLAAGGTAELGNSLTLGVLGAVKARGLSPCVQALPAPSWPPITPPDLSTPLGATAHHAALSVSGPFLEQALHELHQAGAFCWNLNPEAFPDLNSDTAGALLPSLPLLLKREGRPAPLRVRLRLPNPPEVTLGLGTHVQTAPLLTLESRELEIELEALLDDRWVRLVSARAALRLPFVALPETCGRVTLGFPAFAQTLTFRGLAANELLAEGDPEFNALVNALLSWVEPQVRRALTGLPLPKLGGAGLQLVQARGLGPSATNRPFTQLGFYANLVPLGAGCSPE